MEMYQEKEHCEEYEQRFLVSFLIISVHYIISLSLQYIKYVMVMGIQYIQ